MGEHFFNSRSKVLLVKRFALCCLVICSFWFNFEFLIFFILSHCRTERIFGHFVTLNPPTYDQLSIDTGAMSKTRVGMLVTSLTNASIIALTRNQICTSPSLISSSSCFILLSVVLQNEFNKLLVYSVGTLLTALSVICLLFTLALMRATSKLFRTATYKRNNTSIVT